MLTTNDPKGRRVNGSIGEVRSLNTKNQTVEIQL